MTKRRGIFSGSRQHAARAPLAARGGEGGVVAVILAIMLLALAGMGALAIDLGRAFNLETQMQKAADAAALVCAGRLDFRLPTIQSKATPAAVGDFATPETALARNTQNFSNDGEPNVISPSSTIVEFFYTNPGPASTPIDVFTDSNAWQARFCRVTVAASQVGFSFAGLIGGPANAQISAQAVATVDILACQHPLMMMCSPTLPPLGLPADFANDNFVASLAGRGMLLRPGVAPGNTGGAGAGASYGILMPGPAPAAPVDNFFAGRISPTENCTPVGLTTVNPPTRRTIASATVAGGLNRRMGVGSVSPHYPAAASTFNFPRDNNVAAPSPPAVALGGMTGAGHHAIGSGVWNCKAYMDTNHPGVNINTITRLDGSPCAYRPDGLTCDANTCRRFEVYLSEIGGPTAGATTPDRRIITLPVVTNCTAANPTPINWVEVFLTEQAGAAPIPSTPANHETTGSHVANEIYAEFIGRADRFGQGVMRRFVRLVE